MKPNFTDFRILGIILGGALSLAAANAVHAGPSFDCDRASADDEIAICSSSQLSELDNLMAAGFQFLRLHAGKKEANRIAKPLLALRQACGGDAACIRKRQVDAVRTYRKLGAPIRLPSWLGAPDDDSDDDSSVADNDTAPSGKLPTRIGACAKSTIDSIGGRLEGDDAFESGTSVSFRNGGGQVSYDKETAIIHSRIGDPVRICLVSVPKGCPPGDDRGKVYNTTNLRTGESWELPDSQHECGGA